MAEAKGGKSRLDTSTLKGPQFQWQWIGAWYKQLANDNATSAGDGKDLYDQWSPNKSPILTLIVNLNLYKKKDQLRFGAQPWTADKRLWNDWPTKGRGRF